MSVLVKGMAMPSRGEYILRMYVWPDGTAIIEGAYCRFEGEPFVAVPVPPHGDLIDRDALMLRINMHGTNKFGILDEDIRQFIADVPTIIPAEEAND